MDRRDAVNLAAAMDDGEWAQFVSEARGTDLDTDKRLRAAESSGDWRTSMAIKAQQLQQLFNNPEGTK